MCHKNSYALSCSIKALKSCLVILNKSEYTSLTFLSYKANPLSIRTTVWNKRNELSQQKQKKYHHRSTDKAENQQEAWKIRCEDPGSEWWLAITKSKVTHRNNWGIVWLCQALDNHECYLWTMDAPNSCGISSKCCLPLHMGKPKWGHLRGQT